MSYYIKYKDEEIKLKDIKDFSFKEYNLLLDILNYEFKNIEEQYILLLELFTDLELEQIKEIKNIFSIDFNTILKQEIMMKKFDNRFLDYEFTALEDMSIGRFIDLEYYLLYGGSERIESVVALLFIGNDDISSFEELRDMIVSKMNIGRALYYFNIFSEFRINFYKIYSGLFKKVNDDEEDEEIEIPIEEEEEYDKELEEDEELDKNNIGLLEFIYILSGDDYLKIEELLKQHIYSIMNYIGWMKERNDKMEEQQKRKNKYGTI